MPFLFVVFALCRSHTNIKSYSGTNNSKTSKDQLPLGQTNGSSGTNLVDVSSNNSISKTSGSAGDFPGDGPNRGKSLSSNKYNSFLILLIGVLTEMADILSQIINIYNSVAVGSRMNRSNVARVHRLISNLQDLIRNNITTLFELRSMLNIQSVTPRGAYPPVIAGMNNIDGNISEALITLNNHLNYLRVLREGEGPSNYMPNPGYLNIVLGQINEVISRLRSMP